MNSLCLLDSSDNFYLLHFFYVKVDALVDPLDNAMLCPSVEEIDQYFLPENRRLDHLSAEEKLSIELEELDGANQELYSGLLSYLSTPTNDLLALLLDLTKKQQLPYDPEKDPDELDLLLRASDLYIDT